MTSRVPQTSAVDPSNWRKDKRKTSERGYGWGWQKARAAFLAKPENVLCRMCLAKGLYTPATVVDHIIPHRGDQKLFWDRSNWQPLCATCHSSTKQAQEKSAKRAVGVDGWPA